ncbi:hypothetical protein [Salinisphaera aquimarina]|uniref:Uncharacterized protein n=1 Tax=Salinisphaera aquimarina TaxID=2094031 RepID=A0ABV7ERH7_9GAMM
MTTSARATRRDKGTWRRYGAADWLGLAASPSFALMAWIAGTGAPGTALCSAAPAGLSIGGMAWMYLLMSVFHMSPWLRIASDRLQRVTRPISKALGG